MHIPFTLPLVGLLFGSLPNPGFSAEAYLSARVFGARDAGASSLDIVAQNASDIIEAGEFFRRIPYHQMLLRIDVVGPATINGTLTANGNVALGDSTTDTLTVAPNAVTWSGNPTHSGNHTWSGNMTMNGNNVIGNSTTDTLTVAPNAVTWSGNPTHSGNHVFSANVTVNGNAVIGDSTTDTLTIAPNAVTWSGNPTHSGNHTWSGNMTMNGNNVIGNSTTDTLTVAPNAVTWSGNPTHSGNHVFSGNVSVNGNTAIGDTSADTLTFNAGTWTLASDVTATRTAGTVAAGSVNSIQYNATFTGDAGGTTSLGFLNASVTSQGANVILGTNAFDALSTHAGTNTVTSLRGFRSGVAVSSSGNVTTATGYATKAISLTSTGVVTSAIQHGSTDWGHATLVTNGIVFDAADQTACATLTTGFRGQLTSGTGKWNAYMSGTAANAFAGNVRIGSVVAPTVALDVTGSAIISTNLTVNGNTALGDSTTDTLTIAPNAVTWSGNPTHSGNHVFSGNVSVNGNTVIGDSSTDTFTVAPNAVTWSGNPTHSGNHTWSGNMTMNGNNVIGNSTTDTLTIAPNAVTWSGNPTHSGNHIFSGTEAVVGGITSGNTAAITSALLQVAAVDGGAICDVLRYSADNSGPTFRGLKSRNASIGGHTVVQSGDTIVGLQGSGSDGTAFRLGGEIRLVVDGTPGASDMPGRWEIYTTPDGSATPALAVTIAQDKLVTMAGGLTVNGNVTLGDSTPDTLTVWPSAVTWSGNPTHSGNHVFSANVTVNGNTVIGDSTTDTLTVASNAVTWSGNPTHSGNHTFSGNVTANGNNVLGNSTTDTLTIAPNAVTWSGNPTHSGNHTFSGTETVAGTLTPQALVDISGASAGQIKFPAAQNASADANTLDDYEEATWTPILTFATPGDVSVSYSNQTGTVTKVGRLVTATFSILTSAFTFTTASGNLQVTGLPYTSLTLSGHTWINALRWGGITKATYTDINTRVSSNSAIVRFTASGSAVAAASVSATDTPTAGTMVLESTMSYEST